MKKSDITSMEDIKLLVDSFYDKVNRDSLLSNVFNDVAKIDWPSHLPKMYAFWSTQLLGSASYFGKPFPPHMKLSINEMHFEHWISLFIQTVDEHFKGTVAEVAKQKAKNIAAVFQYKLGITGSF